MGDQQSKGIVGGVLMGVCMVTIICFMSCMNGYQDHLRKEIEDDFVSVATKVSILKKKVNRMRRNNYNDHQHSDSDSEDFTQSNDEEIPLNRP